MFSPKKYTWWYIGNAVRSEITQIGIMQNLIWFPLLNLGDLRREYSIERKIKAQDFPPASEFDQKNGIN